MSVLISVHDDLARRPLARIVREVAEIAEFLIHSRYDSSEVENFLAPIATARSAAAESVVK